MQVAGLVFEHDRNAVAYREGQLIGGTNQFLVFTFIVQGPFAKRANQNFKQAGFHGRLLAIIGSSPEV
jgi:hypothetical protein